MLTERNFFTLFLSASLLLVILQILGVLFYFFWKFPWIDIPMHFLGGFIVALAAFAFLGYFKSIWFPVSHRFIFLFLITVALSVGVGWEFFELATKTSFLNAPGFIFDTVKDIVNDTLGSLAAWYFIIRQYASSFV